CQHHYGTPFTF
nr:immunoglobulin light chain junction region [Mus musculus]NSL97027.1 immunoglobulin light chain junction region [Mus musculus]NSL97032.1 immunoglobulin light chain junction region [Mus musculus]NSL97165.1 immunoglobulin light chain junction region [Mus musculus]NSL97180.1 immunoglobulin light chain junction region [Mus musculus]